MLKRDIADKIYSIAIKRFTSEKPEIKLDDVMLERIWYSIYGIVQHEGEDAAIEYVKNAKFIEKEELYYWTPVTYRG